MTQPHETIRRLRRIGKVLENLEHDYRWAHDLGHHGSPGTGLKVKQDASDPTGNVVSDPHRDRARAITRQAQRDIKAATQLLEGAAGALDRLFGKGRTERPPGMPPIMPDREMAPLEAAARRRAARGEGYGSA